MDYKKSKYSDDEGSEDSHSSGGGEEVPPSTVRYGKGKVLYTREDKGKGKQQESAPKLKCFICDGQHLARECPKREALSTLIKKSEKVEEVARIGSMQMLNALQVMTKASSQGSEPGEQAEVAIPHGDEILKSKDKSIGKKR